jgi:hypothetical protein
MQKILPNDVAIDMIISKLPEECIYSMSNECEPIEGHNLNSMFLYPAESVIKTWDYFKLVSGY